MSSTVLPVVVAPQAAASPSAHASSAGTKPEVARAAREFEAIFLRQILTSLEKAGRVSSTGSTGSDVYGSMMVGALADAVASAGGVGLAKYVTTSLEHSPVVPPNHPSGIPLQRPNPTAIQPPSKTSEKGIP